ncbi:MAG TPA: 3-oxoacyl-ACP synthase [Cyclobacteriaceae bacterium]|nr:3-oxoacyl-ACP synthase [Cyclobacteriaceae bacterium]
MTSIKQQLYANCLAFVEQRIASAQEAIAIAQQSANEETKSSAGDKYETGRAMAQLEIEKNSAHLAESLKLKQTLEKIDADQKSDTVRIGSLVKTNHGNFYLAISAGQFTINHEVYFVISSASPIGQKLMGLHVKHRFLFNNREFLVMQID